MIVNVIYTAQLKSGLDLAGEAVELPDGASVAQLVDQLSLRHGEPFARLMLAQPGQLNSAILVCIGDQCVGRDLSTTLANGAEVTFLSPVSGG